MKVLKNHREFHGDFLCKIIMYVINGYAH